MGISEFKVGAKGNELGSAISSIGESEWGDNAVELKLELNQLSSSIKSIRFYDQNNHELEVNKSGWEGSGEKTTFRFSTEDEFPPKGKIIVEVFGNRQKNKIPFELTNISLLGQAL